MNEITIKFDELIECIKKDDIYKKYNFLKKQMSNNSEIKERINKIKSLQKDIVKKKISNQEYFDLEKEIDAELSELDNIPLYVEYKDSKNELNQLLRNVKFTIEDCINDITN